jgi:uncharacterized protein Veg
MFKEINDVRSDERKKIILSSEDGRRKLEKNDVAIIFILADSNAK